MSDGKVQTTDCSFEKRERERERERDKLDGIYQCIVL
jgi:hypothetical protein